METRELHIRFPVSIRWHEGVITYTSASWDADGIRVRYWRRGKRNKQAAALRQAAEASFQAYGWELISMAYHSGDRDSRCEIKVRSERWRCADDFIRDVWLYASQQASHAYTLAQHGALVKLGVRGGRAHYAALFHTLEQLNILHVLPPKLQDALGVYAWEQSS